MLYMGHVMVMSSSLIVSHKVKSTRFIRLGWRDGSMGKLVAVKTEPELKHWIHMLEERNRF